MNLSNLTSRKGWFRVWLVLSLGWWLFLVAAVAIDFAEGDRLSQSDIQQIIGLSVMPPIVYAAGWILVKAVQWIRAGFKGGE